MPTPRSAVNALHALLAVADDAIALVAGDGALLAASAPFARRLGAAQPGRLDEALGREAWLALRRALDDGAPDAPAAPASARSVRLAVELPTAAGPRRVELRARRVAGSGGAIALALRDADAAPAARDAAPQPEPAIAPARGALHELANLLVSIQFASDALLGEAATPAAAREDLAAIREAAERAGALLVRLRPRVTPPDVDATDLGAAVAACAPLLARLRPPHAPCTVTMPDAPLRVRATREGIEQLLVQLALPASGDAAAAGPLELRVGPATPGGAGAPGRSRATAGRYAAIALRDPAATPAALRARLAGAGSLHARIVDELGGELAIEAAPEGGARVTVYLPRVSDEAPG